MRRYTAASSMRRRTSPRSLEKSLMGADAQDAPWQNLNFLPDPHGHSALRGVFDQSSLSLTIGACLGGAAGAAASGASSPLATAAWAAAWKPSVLVVSAEDSWTLLTIVACCVSGSLRTTWTCMT